jgi:hypothetical protein
VPEFKSIESSLEDINDARLKWDDNKEADIHSRLSDNIEKLMDNPLLKTLRLSDTKIFPIDYNDDNSTYRLEVIDWNLKLGSIEFKEEDYWSKLKTFLTLALEEKINNKNIKITFYVNEDIKELFTRISNSNSRVVVKNLLYVCPADLKDENMSFDTRITNDNFDNFFEII